MMGLGEIVKSYYSIKRPRKLRRREKASTEVKQNKEEERILESFQA